MLIKSVHCWVRAWTQHIGFNWQRKLAECLTRNTCAWSDCVCGLCCCWWWIIMVVVVVAWCWYWLQWLSRWWRSWDRRWRHESRGYLMSTCVVSEACRTSTLIIWWLSWRHCRQTSILYASRISDQLAVCGLLCSLTVLRSSVLCRAAWLADVACYVDVLMREITVCSVHTVAPPCDRPTASGYSPPGTFPLNILFSLRPLTRKKAS